MSNEHAGVDELDPMEAIENDVDSVDAPLPPPETDKDDWWHAGHPGDPDPDPSCYQVPREMDSEDGPPPRRGGPTS